MRYMSESWRKHFGMPMMAPDGAGGGGAGDDKGAGDAGGGKAGGEAGDKGSGEGAGDKDAGGEKDAAKLRAEIEAEVRKSMDADIDRRVTEAVKKTEKRMKEEAAQKEKEKAMTEEEKRKAEADRIASEQAERNRILTEKELRLDLVDVLTETGMDLAFRDLIDVGALVALEADERSKALSEKVQAVKKLFDAEVAKAVASAKAEFLKGTTPDNAGGKGGDQQKDAYTMAAESKNITGMIAAKRAAVAAGRGK